MPPSGCIALGYPSFGTKDLRGLIGLGFAGRRPELVRSLSITRSWITAATSPIWNDSTAPYRRLNHLDQQSPDDCDPQKPTKFVGDVVKNGRAAMAALPDYPSPQERVPITVDGQIVRAVGLPAQLQQLRTRIAQPESFAVRLVDSKTMS